MIARSKQAQDFRGRIVNVASVGGPARTAQLGVYCMSKAAVVHMTPRRRRWSGGATASNVNASMPGYIRTEINEDHWVPMVGES